MASTSDASSFSVGQKRYDKWTESFDSTAASVVSEASSFSIRPLVRYEKPSPFDHSDEDDLNRDLLQIDDDAPSPQPSPRQDLPSRTRFDEFSDEAYRLVIAIDFGTTFTGVGYASVKRNTADLNAIQIIRNWGQKQTNEEKVPSVKSYSPAPNGERQWGKDLSPNAVTMINTKLELDVQDNKIDELELILKLLEGTHNLNFNYIKQSKGDPEYNWKCPEEIMTDYMVHIYETLNGVLREFDAVTSKREVTLVITVPVNWSYQAKNSTFRAIRAAGFNEDRFPGLDTILVTEPEAAAVYTGRYLQSRMELGFLKVDDCFVLCDGGGGTVDVVSYCVKRLEPLELEQVATPCSAKCGSTYVDANFKMWLCRLLGGRHFRNLDPHSKGGKLSRSSETSQMRGVMEQFEYLKKRFSSKTPPNSMKLELPKSLHQISIQGKLNQGELTISNDDMRSFFDPCIDQVLELVYGQRIQILEKKKRRPKNIFLVGGFGKSQYLREELETSLQDRQISIRLPDTSWEAVVRGAVIHGIEKNLNSSVATGTCPRSYAIVLNERRAAMFSRHDRVADKFSGNMIAQNQITWLVRKGDLILSDEGKTVEKEFVVEFSEGNARTFALPIYKYEYDDLAERFEESSGELTTACTLEWNLSNIALDEFERGRKAQSGGHFYTAYLKCKMELSGSEIEIEILFKERRLAARKIRDVEHDDSDYSWG